MSYLHPVRLHFAGRFRADVSTVNNNPSHFNEPFNPDQQKPFSGGSDGSNWQPAGTGAWRLLDCQVTRACRADGPAASTPAGDIAVGLRVRESSDRASAKIVDLDPMQQGVSMIFGLTVCLVDAMGHPLLQGEFEPAAFFDLRSNRSSGGGDAGRSAYFQSVLTNITWGDVAASPCLTQLKAISTAQKLSIRFITDGYQMSLPQRGYGRLTGTVGPYLEDEPHSFVAGRHLQVQTDGPPDLEFAQVDATVDNVRRKILVDVGNLLQVDTTTGEFVDIGELSLAAGDGAAAPSLGSLSYQEPKSYASTAGVYELPAGRTLTDTELAAVTQKPLRLLLRPLGAAASTFASEKDDGFYLRAERFVFRLDPGSSEATNLFVTRFGAAVANAAPQAIAFPFSGLPDLPLPNLAVNPADSKGRARLTITAVNPGQPRPFIDGMVYGIVCVLEQSPGDPNLTINAERNFISVLVFDPAPAIAIPTWENVRPIFKQYGDLYPRPHGPSPYAPFAGLPASHPVVDLGDRDSVTRFARRILWALELPIDHPSHMPVTRDLSAAKRKLLVNWLRTVIPAAAPGGGGLETAMAEAAAVTATAAVAAPTSRSKTSSPAVNIGLLRHRPSQD